MTIDWREVDRWLAGEAWVNSQIDDHLVELCDRIGPRWGSTPEEARAAEYIRGRMEARGLANARLKEFELQSWSHNRSVARVSGDEQPIPVLPYLWCPSTNA